MINAISTTAINAVTTTSRNISFLLSCKDSFSSDCFIFNNLTTMDNKRPVKQKHFIKTKCIFEHIDN